MKHWWHDFRPFFSVFRSQLPSMALSIALGIAATLAGVGLLALSGWFLAATAAAGLVAATAKEFNFFLPSIGVRILAVTRTLTRYGERLAGHDATFRILAGLRTWFYRRLEPLAPARLMRFGSGDILNRIVGDIDALDNLFVRVVAPLAAAGAAGGALVLFLYRIDAGMALITAFAVGIAGGGVPYWSVRSGAAAGEDIVRRQSRLRTGMVTAIQGISELLVFHLKDRYFAEMMADHDSLVAGQRKMAHLAGAANAVLTLISGGAVAAGLMVGVTLVNAGNISGEMLTLAVLAIMAIFEAVWPLPTAFQYFSHTRASARRLVEIVDAPAPVIFKDHSDALPEGIDIFFDGVDFRYGENDPWILKDFTLKIPAGRHIALVGPSGAGKSTVAHLLMRFWDPQAGKIYLGGQEIRKLSESDLRRRLVLISQKAHIFNGTIRTNLLLADQKASAETLREALSAARLDDFVNELPNGLDTWVGEGGKALSGGQRQRLAVARAFLHQAPIWILDEPTEGLDSDTESQLMDTLLKACKGRSLVIVTHRKAVMARVDMRVDLTFTND